MVARCEWSGSLRGCIWSIDKCGIRINGSSSQMSSLTGGGESSQQWAWSAGSGIRKLQIHAAELICTSTVLPLESVSPRWSWAWLLFNLCSSAYLSLTDRLELNLSSYSRSPYLFVSSRSEHWIYLFTCFPFFSPILKSDLSEGRDCFHLVHQYIPSI